MAKEAKDNVVVEDEAKDSMAEEVIVKEVAKEAKDVVVVEDKARDSVAE